MPNRSLGNTLPYRFRNTGSKPAAVERIFQAPPLQLIELKSPLPAKMKAVIAGDEMSTKLELNVQDYHQYPRLERILEGKDQTMRLWEVVIWAGRLELNFYQSISPSTSPSPQIISSQIIIERALELSLNLVAEEYGAETYRQLIFSYGTDAAWGNFVHISEYSKKKGVQDAFFYPEASLNDFGRIIKS